MREASAVDHRRLPIMILAASLLLSLGCSQLVAPPATATPTPSATSTSTLIPTSTATPRPTAAPAASPEGPVTSALADGSTELTDSRFGYTLVLPPGWLVFSPGAEQTESILEAAGELNPELQWMLEGFGGMVAQGMRFMAFPADTLEAEAGSAAAINLVILDGFQLPLDMLLETTSESLEALVPGTEILSQALVPDLNGQPAARIDMLIAITTLEATQLTAHSTLIMLQSQGRLIELTLECEQSLYPDYRPVFEQVLQSLTLL